MPVAGGGGVEDPAALRRGEQGTATLSEARSKLVILGIGDDGLAGLTEPRAGWSWRPT